MITISKYILSINLVEMYFQMWNQKIKNHSW